MRLTLGLMGKERVLPAGLEEGRHGVGLLPASSDGQDVFEGGRQPNERLTEKEKRHP